MNKLFKLSLVMFTCLAGTSKASAKEPVNFLKMIDNIFHLSVVIEWNLKEYQDHVLHIDYSKQYMQKMWKNVDVPLSVLCNKVFQDGNNALSPYSIEAIPHAIYLQKIEKPFNEILKTAHDLAEEYAPIIKQFQEKNNLP